MITVKISTTSKWLSFRQTPGCEGVWDRCKFILNEPTDSCDYFVVFDGLSAPETVLCPPENTLLITAEPHSVKKYPESFSRQFAHVITCQRQMHHASVHYAQQGLPWMIGGEYHRTEGKSGAGFIRDYDELAIMPPQKKERLISVIASDKVMTPGHLLRRRFVDRLRQHFGSSIDVFGGRDTALPDKWSGIAPYRYHIALENSYYPDYWTEKLADTFLARSFPIYYGCPNISEYFPADSLLHIDIRNPDSALAAIEGAVNDDIYSRSGDAMEVSRDLVMNKYNVFALINDFVASNIKDTPKIPISFVPQKQYFLVGKVRRLSNWITNEGL